MSKAVVDHCLLLAIKMTKAALSAAFSGGGEGTCPSNVSIGTDYILNLVLAPSPPAYYGSYNVGA